MVDVSVIVPTFSRPESLIAAVKSILNQSFCGKIEVLVVCNEGCEKSRNAIRDLCDPRVYFFAIENGGIIAKSRNLGLKHANGRYVAFCDDDDYWAADKLKNQMDVVLKYNVDFVACDFEFRDALIPTSLNFLRKNLSKSVSVSNVSFHSAIWRNPFATSSVLVRKKAILDVGGFDEAESVSPFEDYLCWLRLLTQLKAAYLMRLTSVSIYRSVSTSSPKNHRRHKLIAKVLWKLQKTTKLTNTQRIQCCLSYLIRLLAFLLGTKQRGKT